MRRREGFSLVELLVAIAIIGILCAILFPVFLSARERAKRSFCVNNMRQIYLALRLYADDYSGYMPPYPKDVSGKGDFSVQKDGFAPLQSYCKNNKNIFRCPSAGTRKGTELNGAARKAEELGEPPYDLIMPSHVVWQCSYHFWPRLYSYPSNASEDGWTQGRIDCEVSDKDLFLNHTGLRRDSYREAVAIGGPLVDNFLHYYGGTSIHDKDHPLYGVLCLTVKGSVKFLPSNRYPW